MNLDLRKKPKKNVFKFLCRNKVHKKRVEQKVSSKVIDHNSSKLEEKVHSVPICAVLLVESRKVCHLGCPSNYPQEVVNVRSRFLEQDLADFAKVEI